jgi:hypothetical protein
MSNDKPSHLTIGCKLPHGLIIEAKNNDGESVKVTLLGANAARIVGGYGITEGVPADVWGAWLRKNARMKAVTDGQIFVHADLKSAEAIAKERREVKTGFEAIDPIKTGMLRGEDGNDDKGALADYRKRASENPDRNRQRVE